MERSSRRCPKIRVVNHDGRVAVTRTDRSCRWGARTPLPAIIRVVARNGMERMAMTSSAAIFRRRCASRADLRSGPGAHLGSDRRDRRHLRARGSRVIGHRQAAFPTATSPATSCRPRSGFRRPASSPPPATSPARSPSVPLPTAATWNRGDLGGAVGDDACGGGPACTRDRQDRSG